MDRTFDALARNLATGMSRRQAMRTAGAGLLAGLLALLPWDPARAEGAGGPCKQGNKVQCGDKCCDRRTQFCCQSGGQAICCPQDAVACDLVAGLITCLRLPVAA